MSMPIDWTAGATPYSQISALSGAPLAGMEQGQKMAAISALRGINMNDQGSIQNGLGKLVQAGAADQAASISSLALSRWKQLATMKSYDEVPSAFGGGDQGAPPSPDQGQAAPQPAPGMVGDANDPAAQAQAHQFLMAASQGLHAAKATGDPTLQNAQIDALAAQLSKMPGAHADMVAHLAEQAKASPATLDSLIATTDQALDPTQHNVPHPEELSYLQRRGMQITDPNTLQFLARQNILGVDQGSVERALEAGKGYTGTVSPGDQVSTLGTPTSQAPYAPTAISAGQQLVNPNAPPGSPPIAAAPFQPQPVQVAPGSNVYGYDPNNPNGPTAGFSNPNGAPAPGAGGAGGEVKYNNPGAVKVPATGKWPGQTGQTPNGIAIFDNPSDGYAAADANLLSYQTHGVNTVAGIVNRWSPPGVDGNPDQSARIATIAKQVGVDPNQPLDLKGNPVLRHQVLAALIPGEGMSGGSGGNAGGQFGGKVMAPPSQQPGVPGLSQRGFAGEQQAPLPGTYVDPAGARARLQTNPQVQGTLTALENWGAMTKNAPQMTGPAALGMMQNIEKAYSGQARVPTVNSLLDTFSIPQQVRGDIQRAFAGQGVLTTQMRQQLLDAAYNFMASHYKVAQGLVQGEQQAIKQTNGDPTLVNGILPPTLPPHYYLLPPPPSARVTGSTIDTPKGPRVWNGQGWVHPPNA